MADRFLRTGPSVGTGGLIWKIWSWYCSDDPELPAQRRRANFLMSILAPVITMSFWGFGIFYALWDLPNLWPASITCIFGGVFLLLPTITRRDAIKGCLVLVFAASVLFTILNYYFGAGAGLNLVFLTGATVIILILGSKRVRPLLFFVAIPVLISVALPLVFPDPALDGVTPELQSIVYSAVAWISVGSTILMLLFAQFQIDGAEMALEAEHTRSEGLLANLLPREIADRLKSSPSTVIADRLPEVTIIFADIVDFTPRARQMAPHELVSFLNHIFSRFDTLTEKHGLEKIKTIGDAYMVASGMPTQRADHAERATAMAFDMLDVTRDISAETGENLQIRIGLHTGPAIAGVIGNTKVFYDVWGDTVNTASRMESYGSPGQIQVTKATREALGDGYRFEPRGEIDVKGMGRVETFWLTSVG